jgi:hypothetical protein
MPSLGPKYRESGTIVALRAVEQGADWPAEPLDYYADASSTTRTAQLGQRHELAAELALRL